MQRSIQQVQYTCRLGSIQYIRKYRSILAERSIHQIQYTCRDLSIRSRILVEIYSLDPGYLQRSIQQVQYTCRKIYLIHPVFLYRSIQYIQYTCCNAVTPALKCVWYLLALYSFQLYVHLGCSITALTMTRLYCVHCST